MNILLQDSSADRRFSYLALFVTQSVLVCQTNYSSS